MLAVCALIVTAVAFSGFLVSPHSAMAGQSSKNQGPLVIPRNQGSSDTLELPASPGRQGGSLNIPPPLPPATQELTLPSRELRVQPGYEQVTVTVTDPNTNTYVTGLQKGDFKLLLNGQERPIEFFRQDLNTPVSIGILVDTSGSMQPKMGQARNAIANFLNDLNPRDEIFMFAFSSRPYLLQSLTTNHELVLSKLALLYPSGQTSLFDTIVAGLRMVQRGRYDKKALLVVTDGVDTSSTSSTVDDVIGLAKRMGVLVYSIGIGNPNGSAATIQIGPFVIGGDDNRVDAATLTTLSTDTGARTYIVRQVGDGATLSNACKQISRELREQYTVGFVAPDASSGGYRSVGVEVPTHPGAATRVRKGVEVGGPPASSYASDPTP